MYFAFNKSLDLKGKKTHSKWSVMKNWNSVKKRRETKKEKQEAGKQPLGMCPFGKSRLLQSFRRNPNHMIRKYRPHQINKSYPRPRFKCTSCTSPPREGGTFTLHQLKGTPARADLNEYGLHWAHLFPGAIKFSYRHFSKIFFYSSVMLRRGFI
ncbi:hypothetical protein TNCV_5085941 [Trichonephila clavipes]|uniref:Uncharacterized protein n=1 Tax=Trichonephila clavipes TaxID=2585209 RepID=A0A8X6S5V6_TRICX|nr:hypothetical protein TNCV_5085941 [Trichonephila clavipes]